MSLYCPMFCSNTVPEWCLLVFCLFIRYVIIMIQKSLITHRSFLGYTWRKNQRVVNSFKEGYNLDTIKKSWSLDMCIGFEVLLFILISPTLASLIWTPDQYDTVNVPVSVVGSLASLVTRYLAKFVKLWVAALQKIIAHGKI